MCLQLEQVGSSHDTHPDLCDLCDGGSSSCMWIGECDFPLSLCLNSSTNSYAHVWRVDTEPFFSGEGPTFIGQSKQLHSSKLSQFLSLLSPE